MKKAAKILYIVSIVLCAISVLSCALCAVFSETLTKNYSADIIKFINENGSLTVNGQKREMTDKDLEFVNALIVVSMIVSTAACALGLIFSIVGLSAIGKEKTSSTPYVLSIVFGALSSAFLLAAGILGVIWASKARKAHESEIVEA